MIASFDGPEDHVRKRHKDSEVYIDIFGVEWRKGHKESEVERSKDIHIYL